MRTSTALAAAPPLLAGGFLLVAIAGLAGAALPALGYLPALGGVSLSLEPLRDLLALPGIWRSAALSLWTGLASGALALAVAIAFFAAWNASRPMRFAMRLVPPFLAIPHAATALGLAFLIAPSGWLLRLVSPWATGLETAPDLLIVGDPNGLSLIAGLVLKEVPFLFLVIAAALPQCDARRRLDVAASLGYRPVAAWIKVVFPAVYRQIRLPVYAVLAYATSTVDMALILGPATPPTLAVRVTQLVADPDLSLRFAAAAGAMLQLSVTLAAFGVWRLGEAILSRLASRMAQDGRRDLAETAVRIVAVTVVAVGAAAIAASVLGLLLSSVAGPWRFPDALPQGLTLQHWLRSLASADRLIATTALLAVLSVALSLATVIAVLEAGERRPTLLPVWIFLVVPMLVPQPVFLFGLRSAFLQIGIGPGFWPVLIGHVIFVLPYVYLALAPTWASWDRRFGTVATSLGAGPWRTLLRVRLPMLLAPLLAAAAIGFAVSVAQYLPTLLLGGGRVETVTTEAVALAAGGNRRIVGVLATLQAGLPLLVFALAVALPALIHRRRRGVAVDR
jgi:putative thiamine transport system permease protein